MTAQECMQYCLSKPFAEETHPFGFLPFVYKVCGKCFAEFYPEADDFKITLKCEPLRAQFYRQQYPDAVVRGYHCPRVMWPYWNTASLDLLDDDLIFAMIDHSYEQVVAKLPKKQRELLFPQK